MNTNPQSYTKPYVAPSWLPGGNAQTIYPFFAKPSEEIRYRRERWEIEDGDFVDVDWFDGNDESPLVILFHGLEGGSRSYYALGMMQYLKQFGWRGVVIHFRGCSGLSNRLPRAYHAGDSDEIDWMIRRAAQQNTKLGANRKVYTLGVSLGGNALLKWLGERGTEASQFISGAATISVPLDLAAAGKALDAGFNQVYTRYFLSTLTYKALEKTDRFPGLFDAKALASCSSIYQFDNLVTAPLHGFRDTDDYWQKSSSKPWLQSIEVPTLVINARNDPFMPASVLPEPAEVSNAVVLVFPETGGHAGFIQGIFPGQMDWLPKRIVSFFHHECLTS